MKRANPLLIILILFILSACSNDRLDVDVSDVELEIDFERIEQKLSKAQGIEGLKAVNQDLIENVGELYEFYVFDMLHSGSVYDDSIAYYLNYFVQDEMMQKVHLDIETNFSNFETEEQETFVDMFKHLKYHIPTAPMPKQIVTYNSAFNYGVISTENQIGLGLDMYLGEHNEVIERLGFPQYIKAKMSKEYMAVDVAHSWLMTNVLGEDRGDDFLDQMIYFGKLRYLIDAMLPDQEDHYKIRYTKEEYDFALASEYDIWLFIMDMQWVYTTDLKVLVRFFDEAPTTVGIDGSPGRIGQFIGWQIVRQYMNENEDVTVEDLVKETNYGKILKYYKPEDE